MMAKLPYGGFEFDNASSAPWLNLFAIAESLEKGEPLRPNLAYWLAKAIRSADMKESKLLLNLGFGKGFARGGQEKIDKGWLIYGQKVVELEDEGVPKDKALSIVLQDILDNDPLKEGVSRTTLQRWVAFYKKVQIEYFTAHE